MLIRSIKIANFRRISACHLTFGAGLNVLHGPNELGKSTLAEALRAVLLVPSTSTAVQEYRPWGSDAVPEVTLVFDHGGVTWSLQKSFAIGTRGKALLERLTESGAYVEDARGRAVDGKIRAMLGWGLAAPGGKARPTNSTFLATALLAPQGKVDALLQEGLETDADASGRALITRALGALGQDQLVKLILDRVQEKIEGAYTDKGRQRNSADSPFATSSHRIIEKEGNLAVLEESLARSQVVEAEVRQLRALRDQVLAARDDAQRSAEGLEARRRGATVRQQVEEELARAQVDLDRVAAHEQAVLTEEEALRALDGQCAASETALREAQALADQAARTRDEVLDRSQAARSAEETAAAVAVQARDQRRLELRHEIEAAERLGQEARSAVEAKARAGDLAQGAVAVEAILRVAEDALRRAEGQVALCEALARWRDAQARQEARRSAAVALDQALGDEEVARKDLSTADGRVRHADEAIESVRAESEAAASGVGRRAAEHEAARTRLVEVEMQERKLRDRLDRQRAIDAKRGALARTSDQRDAFDRRVASLREALGQNALRADAARERGSRLGEMQRFRELAKLRARLATLEDRQMRGRSCREQQDRLRREADAHTREAEGRRPASVEEIERLRVLARDQSRTRSEEPKVAPVPIVGPVLIGFVAGGIAFAVTGRAFGFGTSAAAIGIVVALAVIGIAVVALRSRALTGAREMWSARVRDVDARWAAEGEPRLRASGAADIDALEATSRTAAQQREQARVASTGVDRLETEIRDLSVAPEQVEDARRAVETCEGEFGATPREEIERESAGVGDDAAVLREVQNARRAMEDLDRERGKLREDLAEVQPSHRAMALQVETATQELAVLVEAAGGTLTDVSGNASDPQLMSDALAHLAVEAQQLRTKLGVVEASPVAVESDGQKGGPLDALREEREAARLVRQTASERLEAARDRAVEARTKAEAAEVAARGFDPEACRSEVATLRVALGAPEPVSDGPDPKEARRAVELAQTTRDEARHALEAKRALAEAEGARAASLIAALGRAPEEVIAYAEARRIAATSALDALASLIISSHPSDPLHAAGPPMHPGRIEVEAAATVAGQVLEEARQQLEGAGQKHNTTRSDRDVVQGRLEALRRSPPDRTTAEAAMQAVRQRATDVAQVEPVGDETLAGALALLDTSTHALTDAEGKLREAQGQLQLLGGAVLAERCREAREQLERLRQAHHELEQHLEGHRLLADTLKRLDAERSSHLGRSLAKPVSERFRALAGGPYANVRIGPSLRAEGIEAAGELRGLDVLSVGTRDQLATLVRLAIAEHLQTALLLDDQLTQSDATRMHWIRSALRAAARTGTQILVLTCRPTDYLDATEIPTPTEVTAIDLACMLTHRLATASAT